MGSKSASGLIIDDYAADHGISSTIAYKHRREQSQQWVEWCKEKGYNSEYLPQHEGGKRKMYKKDKKMDKKIVLDKVDATSDEPSGLVERYKLMENKSYQQLRQIQSLLDYAISNEQFQTLRTYIQGVKDLTSTYNDLCRLRRIAEVQEGEILPMNVLERYKTAFYPRLESGVDEMRISIENLLPPDVVPEFQRAWQKSYYRYKDAAREAERAIVDYKIMAADEALAAMNKKESNKLKAQSGIREKVRENLADE